MAQKREIKRFCKELNSLLPCEGEKDVEVFNHTLSYFLQQIPDGKLYWSKDLWTDCGNNANQAREVLLYQDKCVVCPSDEPIHHPGLCVKYKLTKK